MKRKELIEKLDRLTSEYVRRKDADKYGYVRCYTCGVKKPYKEMDCGHYRQRRYIQTRFDLDNLRPQCYSCNRFKQGNLEIFRDRLVKELGEDKVVEIETRPSRKPFEIELENLIELRKHDIDDLPKIEYY